MSAYTLEHTSIHAEIQAFSCRESDSTCLRHRTVRSRSSSKSHRNAPLLMAEIRPPSNRPSYIGTIHPTHTTKNMLLLERETHIYIHVQRRRCPKKSRRKDQNRRKNSTTRLMGVLHKSRLWFRRPANTPHASPKKKVQPMQLIFLYGKYTQYGCT